MICLIIGKALICRRFNDLNINLAVSFKMPKTGTLFFRSLALFFFGLGVSLFLGPPKYDSSNSLSPLNKGGVVFPDIEVFFSLKRRYHKLAVLRLSISFGRLSGG